MDHDIIAAVYRQQRMQQRDEIEKILRAAIGRMPEDTPRERIEKALATYLMAAQLEVVMEQGVPAAEDFAKQVSVAFLYFFDACLNVEEPENARKKFVRQMDSIGTQAIDSFGSIEAHTHAHIYYTAFGFLQDAFKEVLGVELRNETPEEKVMDHFFGEPDDTIH